MASKKVALIIGAGEGLGSSLAREFASHDFITVVCRRSKEKLQPLIEEIQAQGKQCFGYGIDGTKEDQIKNLVSEVEEKYGPIEVGIFNQGTFLRKSFLETSAEEFQENWESNTLAGFLFGKEVAQRMVQRKQGTIIFTGATASQRGASHFSAFSSGKGGLRNLAQSMAKELGGLNVHVSHVIVDGLIDTERVRGMFKENLDKIQMINPDEIAKSYWFLHTQPKNCWSFEFDVRPFNEKW